MTKAHSDTEQSSKQIDSKTPPYPYVISIPKLIIMSITTFGLYEVYWFYKQFKSFKAEKEWKITPWLRALFANLMSYSLFKKVSIAAEEFDKKRKLKAFGSSLLYFIINSLWKLPDPYWLLSLLSFIPLLVIQDNINFYWKKQYGNKIIQSKFGRSNYIWAIIGGLIVLLAIWGTFLPQED